MKKLFGIFLLLFISIISYGQSGQAVDKKISNRYGLYVKNLSATETPLSFEDWKAIEIDKTMTNKPIKTYPYSPGYYLKKASGNFAAAVVLDVFAGGFLYLNVTSKNPSKPVTATCAGIGLISFGYYISGIVNIKNAGIVLDSNGIGIKIKF